MALSFPSSGSEVDFGSSVSLDNISAGTRLAWVFPTDVVNTPPPHISDKRAAASDWKTFLVATGSAPGELQFTVARATTALAVASAPSFITEDEWQFVGCTWDLSGGDTSQKLYRGTVDTIVTEASSYSVQQAGSGATDDGSGPLTVGGVDAVGGVHWVGSIAFYAEFNRILSLAEIRSLQFKPYPIAGCVLFCHLGFTGASATQPDWSGNGNNGTPTSTTLATHAPVGAFFGNDEEGRLLPPPAPTYDYVFDIFDHMPAGSQYAVGSVDITLMATNGAGTWTFDADDSDGVITYTFDDQEFCEHVTATFEVVADPAVCDCPPKQFFVDIIPPSPAGCLPTVEVPCQDAPSCDVCPPGTDFDCVLGPKFQLNYDQAATNVHVVEAIGEIFDSLPHALNFTDIACRYARTWLLPSGGSVSVHLTFRHGGPIIEVRIRDDADKIIGRGEFEKSCLDFDCDAQYDLTSRLGSYTGPNGETNWTGATARLNPESNIVGQCTDPNGLVTQPCGSSSDGIPDPLHITIFGVEEGQVVDPPSSLIQPHPNAPDAFNASHVMPIVTPCAAETTTLMRRNIAGGGETDPLDVKINVLAFTDVSDDVRLRVTFNTASVASDLSHVIETDPIGTAISPPDLRGAFLFTPSDYTIITDASDNFYWPIFTNMTVQIHAQM